MPTITSLYGGAVRRKVLLFNPESEFYAMPLGLLAVGSALDPDQFDVRIFDARLDRDATAKLMAEADGGACVGVTVFSGPPIGRALEASRDLKRRFPALPIVWGGWHPSILPEQCIASGVVDVVVIGQGEATFAEVVGSIDSPAQWSNIPGLCIPANGAVKRTASRPLSKMDAFPPVRYELLDVGSYFHHKGKRQLDYSSSRGCPYKCTFCADPMVYRSKWTGLPADRVVRELLALHSRYRMDEVLFLDDDLFASLKRIRELADAFIDAAVPFAWKGTARADELCRLPEDFFPRLRQAGCKRINVGAESGSQKVLDQIKKEYQVDEILIAAERAARAGISLSYSFIAGFPGETARDFQSTIDVLKAIRSKGSTIEASIYFYSPYPGTELVQELERDGLRLPEKLEQWENFNIEGAWLGRNNRRLIHRVRNLNFYLRHGYAMQAGSTTRRVLRSISRFRCEHDWYGVPIERYLVQTALHIQSRIRKTSIELPL
jgi:anaerobic magnesium-protoporphyrin IX monomethyl ester cyclase